MPIPRIFLQFPFDPLGWLVLLAVLAPRLVAADEAALPNELQDRMAKVVQPMTGIVLWTTNPAVESAPIQLEFSYLSYNQILQEPGRYDWSVLDRLLEEVAGRRHQLILRWHDTYVGKKSGIPDFVRREKGYAGKRAKSEKEWTEFPDWSHPTLQSWCLEFFSRFADKYDRDPRIAFVQVGFGLWSEYHIYDGPMELGKTFPSKEYQATFANHLSEVLRETPWMISVDAANAEWSPYPEQESLRRLAFGLFDDSFNHRQHAKENEPNWRALGLDRWQVAPCGGEFAFFEKKDQTQALAPRGPHGIPFEEHAKRFHLTFIIGDAQTEYQKPERIREAGSVCGYRFRLISNVMSATSMKREVRFRNEGIAPIYFDAFPEIEGRRSEESLKGLMPGEERTFQVEASSASSPVRIACDRLVPGQSITFAEDP